MNLNDSIKENLLVDLNRVQSFCHGLHSIHLRLSTSTESKGLPCNRWERLKLSQKKRIYQMNEMIQSHNLCVCCIATATIFGNQTNRWRYKRWSKRKIWYAERRQLYPSRIFLLALSKIKSIPEAQIRQWWKRKWKYFQRLAGAP